jgi:ATP-dependent RNA helicase HelY
MAVVLNPPPAGDDFSPHRADGPLVLTAHGQLKQLSAADFPVPADPVDRLRIPASFSERSPKHRRDLVSAMRSKLAGGPVAGNAGDPSPRRRRPAAGADDDYSERFRGASRHADDFEEGEDTARPDAEEERYDDLAVADRGTRDRRSRRGSADEAGGDGDIAELRRKLRRHPCHACPDREQHARYAERYFRQMKEVTDLEHQVAGRRHVIARTFDRVCKVLDELGYLDGDTVTPAGQRLTRLYSELDLLAAECLRRGVWEGLNPAELAACVSLLTFESRRQTEENGPARLPKGPVRDVLTSMVRTWGELDHLEQRNGLSFLREPDPGFVWAAYRWARGAKLEDVLDSVPGLTPGDFVRSMKQLIDLLDQVAVASRDPNQAAADQAEPAPKTRDVASTARAAIDALRRGVIEYTTLTD